MSDLPDSGVAHTDQCIRDAAQIGFCEHTVLPTGIRTPRYPRLAPPSRRRVVARELLSVLGFFLLGFTTVWLAHVADSTLTTLALVLLPGIGWLLVFTCGLPRLLRDALTWDPREQFPTDVYERLWERPSPYRQKGAPQGPEREE